MTKCLLLVLSLLLVSSPCQAQVDKGLSIAVLHDVCATFFDFHERLADIASNSFEFAPHNVIQSGFLLDASTIARTTAYSCLHIYDILNIALMADNTDVNDFVKTHLPNLIGQYKILSEGGVNKLKIFLELEMPQSAHDAVQDLLEYLEDYSKLLDGIALKHK